MVMAPPESLQGGVSGDCVRTVKEFGGAVQKAGGGGPSACPRWSRSCGLACYFARAVHTWEQDMFHVLLSLAACALGVSILSFNS